MAVNPVDFHISEVEINAKIDLLITDIHTLLEGTGGGDGLVDVLQEDSRGKVSVMSTKAAQFHSDMKYLVSKIRWYLDLTTLGDTYRLIAAYADNYLVNQNVNKYNYALDRITFF